MEAGEIIVWALCIGIAVNLFFSLTGLGDVVSGVIRKSSRTDLENKIDELESRINKLEAEK